MAARCCLTVGAAASDFGECLDAGRHVRGLDGTEAEPAAVASGEEFRERNRIQLSVLDWEAFAKRLDAAPRKLPELKALLNRESRFQDA